MKNYIERSQLEDLVNNGFNFNINLSGDVNTLTDRIHQIPLIKNEDLLYLLSNREKSSARNLIFYFTLRVIIHWAKYYAKFDNYVYFNDLLQSLFIPLYHLIDSFTPDKCRSGKIFGYFIVSLKPYAWMAFVELKSFIHVPTYVRRNYVENADLIKSVALPVSDVCFNMLGIHYDINRYIDRKNLRNKIHKFLLKYSKKSHDVFFHYLKSESYTETALAFGMTKQGVQFSVRKSAKLILKHFGIKDTKIF